MQDEPEADGKPKTEDPSVSPDMAVLNDALQPCPVLELWDEAMKNVGLLQHTEKELQKEHDPKAKDALQHGAVDALLRAAEALKHLSTEISSEEFKRMAPDEVEVVMCVPHCGAPASAFAEQYFQRSFVDLFPYGDGTEISKVRKAFGNGKLSGTVWAKSLLQRAKCQRWRLCPEFIAVAFNTFLRRDLMRSLYVIIRKPWFQQCAVKLQTLRVTDLLLAANRLGSTASINAVLADAGVPDTVKILALRLQLVQRTVPCTIPYRLGF